MAIRDVSVVLAHGAWAKAHAVDHTPSVTAPGVVVDMIRDAIRSITGD